MTGIGYELAKELKDAGFPQGWWDRTRDGEHYLFRETDDPFPLNNRTMWVRYYKPEFVEKHLSEIVLVPTLSELIGACGSKRVIQGREYQFHLAFFKDEWFAQYDDMDFKLPNPSEQGRGSTPEEAVARLYLEINKKP